MSDISPSGGGYAHYNNSFNSSPCFLVQAFQTCINCPLVGYVTYMNNIQHLYGLYLTNSLTNIRFHINHNMTSVRSQVYSHIMRPAVSLGYSWSRLNDYIQESPIRPMINLLNRKNANFIFIKLYVLYDKQQVCVSYFKMNSQKQQFLELLLGVVEIKIGLQGGLSDHHQKRLYVIRGDDQRWSVVGQLAGIFGQYLLKDTLDMSRSLHFWYCAIWLNHVQKQSSFFLFSREKMGQ